MGNLFGRLIVVLSIFISICSIFLVLIGLSVIRYHTYYFLIIIPTTILLSIVPLIILKSQ